MDRLPPTFFGARKIEPLGTYFPADITLSEAGRCLTTMKLKHLESALSSVSREFPSPNVRSDLILHVVKLRVFLHRE